MLSAIIEAFSGVKIDEQLKDVGWNLTDGQSVLNEYSLPDGTHADYVPCDRGGCPPAVLAEPPIVQVREQVASGIGIVRATL